MGDLGIAKVEVSINSSLANVVPKPEMPNVDIVVNDDPRQFLSNGERSSRGIEVTTDLNGNWSMVHCARKYIQKSNYISGGSTSTPPTGSITWNATDALPDEVKGNDKLLGPDQVTDFQPPANGGYPTDYKGPRWQNIYQGSTGSTNATLGETSTSGPAVEFDKYSGAIEQYESLPGMWWGVTCSPGFSKQQGFYLDIQRAAEITSKNQPSWILIKIEGEKEFWIWLMTDEKPLLWDKKADIKETMHGCGGLTRGGSIRFGVMPLGGRIVFSINGGDYVFAGRSSTTSSGGGGTIATNDPKTFDLQPVFFEPTDISVFGSNCRAVVSLANMGFSKGKVYTPALGAAMLDGTTSGSYDGNLFTIETSTGEIYGATSTQYGEDGHGTITETFEPCNQSSNATVCVLEMEADDIGTPGVSRIKGSKNAPAGASPKRGVTIKSGSNRRKRVLKGGKAGGEPVIGLNMTFTAPDFYHSRHTAEVTIYNPGGGNSSFLDSSQGVEISCGWGSANKVFTGVTLGGYNVESPGLESIVLNCEDYMFILDSCMMINSPYYDGMKAANAITDLAARAGITALDDSEVSDYALPSGYSHTKPLYRFSKGRTIKDCILDIVKLTECTIYFDPEGKLHYTGIQGGIAYGGGSSGADIAASTSGNNIVLDELRMGTKLSQAINCLNVETVDRTSGNPIIITKYADSAGDLFPYLKQGFNPCGMFGSWQAANAWITMISERVFKAAHEASAKTPDPGGIIPMQNITIAGQKIRVNQVQRNYSAYENSLTATVSGDWYG